jgi:hypothetical protein
VPPRTRPSIEKQNRPRYVKNRGNRGSSRMYPMLKMCTTVATSVIIANIVIVRLST